MRDEDDIKDVNDIEVNEEGMDVNPSDAEQND